MGLRIELRLDGDKCKACRAPLWKSGQEVSRRQRIDDEMKITVIRLQCRLCGEVSDILFWAELLPTERMREMIRSHQFPQSNTAAIPQVKPFNAR